MKDYVRGKFRLASDGVFKIPQLLRAEGFRFMTTIVPAQAAVDRDTPHEHQNKGNPWPPRAGRDDL